MDIHGHLCEGPTDEIAQRLETRQETGPIRQVSRCANRRGLSAPFGITGDYWLMAKTTRRRSLLNSGPGLESTTIRAAARCRTTCLPAATTPRHTCMPWRICAVHLDRNHWRSCRNPIKDESRLADDW